MVNSAIILAGGKGERLRPYTNKLPKSMIPVLGRPLMEYQVRWLHHEGIKHIVFCVGYKYKAIKDYFQDGSKWGMKFDYAIEKEPLGRGGGFKNGLKFIPSDERVVIGANGDELTGEPLEPMIDYHLKNKAAGTLLLIRLISPFGIVELADDGHVAQFREKPELPHWISAGVYILERSTIEMFPDIGDHEDTTFPKLAKKGKLFGYPATTFRTTINTVKELHEANQELHKRLPPYLLPEGIDLG